jgi:hypothetical protein
MDEKSLPDTAESKVKEQERREFLKSVILAGVVLTSPALASSDRVFSEQDFDLDTKAELSMNDQQGPPAPPPSTGCTTSCPTCGCTVSCPTCGCTTGCPSTGC